MPNNFFFILLRLEDLENIYSQYSVLVSPETRDNGLLGGWGRERKTKTKPSGWDTETDYVFVSQYSGKIDMTGGGSGV